MLTCTPYVQASQKENQINFFKYCILKRDKNIGLMIRAGIKIMIVSELVFRLSSLYSSSIRGHCFMFFVKTLYSLSPYLHAGGNWVPANVMQLGLGVTL